jgi:hypothetical protein
MIAPGELVMMPSSRRAMHLGLGSSAEPFVVSGRRTCLLTSGFLRLGMRLPNRGKLFGRKLRDNRLARYHVTACILQLAHQTA